MRHPDFGSNKSSIPNQHIEDKKKASLISSILSKKGTNKDIDPNIDPVSGKPLLGAVVSTPNALPIQPAPLVHPHMPALPAQPAKIPFKDMLAIHKQAAEHSDEPKLKERSIYTSLDKALIMCALLVMVFGTFIIYNQIPTHPLLVLGILLVCVSSGIVTSIARW